MPEKKERLDELLVRRGLCPSRSKAAAIILAGNVLVGDRPVTKAGTKVASDSVLRLRGNQLRYVSRGGDKLEGAIRHFDVSVVDAVAIDVGASTGGFTDCLLSFGARLVYAVDVGYNQLAYRLRADPRVKVFEKRHAKDLGQLSFDPQPTFASVDLSFISVRKVLHPLVAVLGRPGAMLILVKPQFELEREYVEKGGVVRKVEHGLLAVRLVAEFCSELGLEVVGSVESVLKGAKKQNQEYFLYLKAH